MPENTMRIGRHMPGTRLDRLVTQKVTEILDAMPDAPGRRDRRGVQIRAFQRVEGVPRRPLQARAHRQGRHARAEGAQTEGRPVRIGGGRTLPPVRGSVEEALTDVCMAGVSTRQVDDISQLP